MFFLSFQVHFWKLIFSDNQGNGTVSTVLAIILCDSPCHKHLKNYLIIFLMLNVPFFLNSVSLNLLTYAKQTNHHETKKQRKETENVINSDLTLGLKKRGDLANKTKALTKGERLKNGFGQ